MFVTAGTVSFLLFLLGDLNDAFWHRRFLRPAFLTGAVLLPIATAGTIFEDLPEAFGPAQMLAIPVVLLFTVLLVWALFFSFPPKEAYVEDIRERKVYTGGMYALCRHPGILWFCFLYACLIPAAGFPPMTAALYSLLNILLGWVEDRWIFPRLFTDYKDYQQSTPFLIPTRKSIRAWIHPVGQKP